MTYPELYIALFCLVLLFLWRRNGLNLNFPGPRGIPIVGCFFSICSRPMHQVLYDWSLQYGGAFKFSLFGSQFLVLSHPDTLQEALVSRGKAYAGRPKLYPLQVFSDNYQDLALTTNLALTNILRKAVHGSIKAYGTGRSELAAILDSSTADLVDGFEATNPSQPVDPMSMIYRATAVSVCLLLSGQRLDDEIPDVYQIVEDFDGIQGDVLALSLGNVMLDALPFLRGVPWFPANRDLKQVISIRTKMFERFVSTALEKSKQSSERTVGKGLLDIVGQKYGDEDDAGEVNMDNVYLTCMNLIAGGTATTTATFYALLNILQWNPDIQEKIYQEVMREVGDGRAVVLEDRDKMPYSRAVVLEALRYAPAVLLGVTHIAREDTELSGNNVPQGTPVITNLWACNHDPKLWEDPWAFKPERFLDEVGQLVLPDHVNRKQLFTFGAGPRVCVGELMATSRLFLFAANCVQRFRFSPPDGADPSSCDGRTYSSGIIVKPTVYQTKISLRK